MSRGPGKIGRAIKAAFAADPDNAFLLCELCERVYVGLNHVEKKHRVAVARAAKAIPTIASLAREALGSELVYYDPLNVMSYAMARLKGDFPNNNYRNNDPRRAKIRARLEMLSKSKRYAGLYNLEPEITEQELREMLAPGGNKHKHVVEGGAWWEYTRIAKLRADGRVEEAERAMNELRERIMQPVRDMH